MNVPKDNNELIQYIKVQQAINFMILREVRQIKKDGGNGASTLPDSIIIRDILEKEALMRRLMKAELEVKAGIYHKSKLKKYVWHMVRRMRRFARKVFHIT